jgi:hypothetical protein
MIFLSIVSKDNIVVINTDLIQQESHSGMNVLDSIAPSPSSKLVIPKQKDVTVALSSEDEAKSNKDLEYSLEENENVDEDIQLKHSDFTIEE